MTLASSDKPTFGRKNDVWAYSDAVPFDEREHSLLSRDSAILGARVIEILSPLLCDVDETFVRTYPFIDIPIAGCQRPEPGTPGRSFT